MVVSTEPLDFQSRLDRLIPNVSKKTTHLQKQKPFSPMKKEQCSKYLDQSMYGVSWMISFNHNTHVMINSDHFLH